jgi:hypothetical protein
MGEGRRERTARIQYEREIETARDWEKNFYTEHFPLLADGKQGGQPDRAGGIARKGNTTAVNFAG